MTYKVQDRFFKKAKAEGYKARSVYKLEEIQTKFKILKKDSWVLDLGCSPGSWSQWVCKHLTSGGGLLGVDLTEVDIKHPRALFVQADMRDFQINKELLPGFPGQFDLVLSDMAPKTTGIKLTDQAKSYELCEIALDTASQWLKTNGHVVIKFFHSDDFSKLKKRIQKEYQRFEALKPESTRSVSKEIFLIGLNKKG